jgi:hypothetical protein
MIHENNTLNDVGVENLIFNNIVFCAKRLTNKYGVTGAFHTVKIQLRET